MRERVVSVVVAVVVAVVMVPCRPSSSTEDPLERIESHGNILEDAVG